MKAKFRALFIFALLSLFACNKVESQKLAEIDGKIVHAAEIEKNAGKELFELRSKVYDLQKRKLDEYIGAVLLTREAERRQVSVSTLLDQEVTAKVAPSNDEEIRELYEAHQARLQVPFEQVREQIREFLSEKKVQERKAIFVSSLRAKANVKTYLTPPPSFQVNLSLSGAPSTGSETSVVTLVKFEDFQCPYCKTVQPVFVDLLKRYSGKLRIVHKDLPLEAIHPQARQAAEAARCAGDQEKFWDYHDKLYERSPKASVNDLKGFAKEIGLNTESFESCFASGKFKAAVQKDLSEAAALGLTGTPAFFINGRELIGAQPIEAFTAIIDEELALTK
ncbi:MAG: DsbA family protein [Candidatus Binatia bacterium]